MFRSTGWIIQAIAILAAFSTTTSAGDLVILHNVQLDSSYRSPAGFRTTDGFGGLIPPAHTKLTDYPKAVPNGMAKAGDILLSTNDPNDMPILEFAVSAGYRAAFGGSQSFPNIHGDLNPLQAGVGLDRLAPSTVNLRFMTKYDSNFFESGQFPGWSLSHFDVNFEGSSGFGGGVIGADPELQLGPPIVTDIALGAAPSIGDTLGKVTLEAGVGVAQSAANYRVDTYVSLVVKNPEIQTMQPMRQFGPWGADAYAPSRVEEFLAGGGVPCTQEVIDAFTTAVGNYTLTQRGCAIASYAAAIDALQIPGVSYDTRSLHQALDSANLISPITGIRNVSAILANPEQTIPILRGADVSPDALMALPALQNRVWIRPSQDINEAAFAPGSGDAVLLSVAGSFGGSHWLVAHGAHLDAGTQQIVFSVYDPGRANNDRTNVAATEIRQMRIVQDHTFRGGMVQINSPIEVRVTDPFGNVAIFDGLNGLISSQIPGAFYEKQEPIISPDDYYDNKDLDLSPDELPGLVYLPALKSGTYTFDVKGIGNGPYSMKFSAPGTDGAFNTLLSQSGNISQGEQFSFQAVVVPEPSALLTAIVGAAILGIAFRTTRMRRNCAAPGRTD